MVLIITSVITAIFMRMADILDFNLVLYVLHDHNKLYTVVDRVYTTSDVLGLVGFDRELM